MENEVVKQTVESGGSPLNDGLEPLPEWAAMTNEKCDGACEEHVGKIRTVSVQGWGTFNYCEAAIKEDCDRGLIVVELEDAELRRAIPHPPQNLRYNSITP